MRVYWHQFVQNHGNVVKKIEKILNRDGFGLKIVFDSHNICRDAYIVKTDKPSIAQPRKK